MSKIIAALTLGCKVNVYDTEAMLEIFAERGYAIGEFEDFADIYIINTCTVTNFGDKKSRQMIRKARRQNPNAIIIAAGCYAQVSPEEIAKIEGINLVIGTKDRQKIVEFIENYDTSTGIQNNVSNIMKERIYEELQVKNLKDRTRAFLKIQEGCDKFCSYCIIPYARGPVRSRKPEDVMTEVKNFVENDFKEIVLAGIHVASYGKDLGNINLIALLRQVLDLDGIERIRFSSIEPNVVTEEFLQLFRSTEKICDHLHLSLQSGCDRTLERMNRSYNTEKYRDAVYRLRESKKDIAITTDIIVGFPNETDEDFEASYNFCKEIGFSKIHVFPYSAKKGTKAAEYPNQIAANIKEERSKKMIELSENLTKVYLNKFINSTVSVLFEKNSEENIYIGYTTNYIQVRVESIAQLENKIIWVKVIRVENDYLTGTIVNDLI